MALYFGSVYKVVYTYILKTVFPVSECKVDKDNVYNDINFKTDEIRLSMYLPYMYIKF